MGRASVRFRREACPPLADFQAVSLRDREGVRRLVDRIAVIAELGDTESIALKERFENGYPLLERAFARVTEEYRILPDRFSGSIVYNDNIAGSKNFQMPELFSYYERELLLVGINLNFLLNLRSSSANFDALLASLIGSHSRKRKILIADLWDQQILYAYDKIVFGNGVTEHAHLCLRRVRPRARPGSGQDPAECMLLTGPPAVTAGLGGSGVPAAVLFIGHGTVIYPPELEIHETFP